MKTHITLLVLLFSMSMPLIAQNSVQKEKKPFWKNIRLPKSNAKLNAELAASAMPQNEETRKVTYQGTVEVPKISRLLLYSRAKKWIAENDIKANKITHFVENEETGTLVAKGAFTLPDLHKKYVVQYVLSISITQGKYSYDITDFTFHLDSAEVGKPFGLVDLGIQLPKKVILFDYTLETFYPSRLNSDQPKIKYFEEIHPSSFAAINREIKLLEGSLIQSMNR